MKTLFELCVEEDVKESLAVDEEEAVSKQKSSGEIREMLKVWETVVSYIEKHHPNKEVAMRAKNLFNDNTMSFDCISILNNVYYVLLSQKQNERIVICQI